MTPTPEGRALVDAIERDETMERDYIPLPGGWELQTKGKGSTFRLCGPNDERLPIPDSPYLHETLTQMARDIHAAALAAMQQPADGGPPCSTHPDAPHGFDRNGSHSADRYMCDCEGWAPDDHAAQLAAKDRELQELRHACWEARAILGFDNDGDPTPDALAFPTLAVMVKRDAAEFRKDYDDACNGLAEYVVLVRAKEAHAEAQDRIILSEQVRCTAAEQRADAAMGLLNRAQPWTARCSGLWTEIRDFLAGGTAEANNG